MIYLKCKQHHKTLIFSTIKNKKFISCAFHLYISSASGRNNQKNVTFAKKKHHETSYIHPYHHRNLDRLHHPSRTHRLPTSIGGCTNSCRPSQIIERRYLAYPSLGTLPNLGAEGLCPFVSSYYPYCLSLLVERRKDQSLQPVRIYSRHKQDRFRIPTRFIQQRLQLRSLL